MTRAPALRASYRLQLRGRVGLREAAELAPYLDELGVSHLYASPLLRACRGSPHGYDVVEPDALDPQLGDVAAFDAFVAALRARGLGWFLDFVPNHVGITGGENPWWWDVLERGRASPYADFFDIDWEPPDAALRNRVLQPCLADDLEAVLGRGELGLVFDPGRGALVLQYHEHRFPLRPESAAALLEAARSEPGPDAADAGLGERAAGIGNARLRELLEEQHYLLANWREAPRAINYRRFFDVNGLAALRMERSEVFERTHRLVFAWLDQGRLDGLRIDHVDGLLDPGGYCRRLRQRLPRAFLVVEKILAVGESLRDDWPVDGTTGYEFLNLVNGLLVDPHGGAALRELYHGLTGRETDFAAVARAAKRLVLENLFPGERERLVAALGALAARDLRAPSTTPAALRRAVTELLAAFPVYRSYVDAAGASAADRRCIAESCRVARQQVPELDAGLLDWLAQVLAAEPAAGSEPGERLGLAQRFQQLSAPLAAKGVEDTAFYRHPVLLGLNEVGGDPGRFGVGVPEFHAANAQRARDHPRSLLASASHDTKRGEDVRARLAVLSELPDEWERVLRELAAAAAPLRRRVDGEPAPAPGDEYALYQTLLGSWPLGARPGAPPAAEALEPYARRIEAYLVKALREAKERSSWRAPAPRYEAACQEFARRALAPGSALHAVLEPFALRVARLGALNGLSQLLLKLTAPGVPDLYQGCELWDLSLVDPDNRRPVDFAARREALAELRRADAPPHELAAALLAAWPDGRIKLFVTWRLLELRRRQPELFASGAYLPLEVRGPRAAHVVAFARRSADAGVVVAAPRLCARLPRARGDFPLGREAWADTELLLPQGWPHAELRHVLSGETLRATHGRSPASLSVAALFRTLPLAAAVLAETRTA